MREVVPLSIFMHTIPKHCEALATKHFKFKEYDCPCDYANCNVTIVDGELLEKVENLRSRIGRPIIITGGFRCAKHQEDLREKGFETAEGRSSHEDGKAADLYCASINGAELALAAEKVGFRNIGTAETWIHADVREGERRWTYSKR